MLLRWDPVDGCASLESTTDVEEIKNVVDRNAVLFECEKFSRVVLPFFIAVYKTDMTTGDRDYFVDQVRRAAVAANAANVDLLHFCFDVEQRSVADGEWRVLSDAN